MEALKLAKLSPQQANRVLFIGDRLDLDIHPSKELGMNVIHFNRSRIRPSVTSAQGEIKTIYDWSEFR
jgi:FMN phosphatase YigB (HAD superfamily)